MATEKNFNSIDPTAPSGARNAIWQENTSAPGGIDPTTGQPYYNSSVYLPDMIGDSGSGGQDGLVPAPSAGSAAAGKFLKADGTFALPPGSPGGFSGQIEFNNSGAFGGFNVGGDGTLVPSTGVLTITKTSGTPFAASATTDTTNASNISSGTLSAARLPTSGVTAGSYTSATISVDAEGRVASAASTAAITALTGDVTASGPGSVAATLALSGVTAGAYTNANITVDGKGRVTAAANGTSLSIFFGQGEATAAMSQNTITLGSTPLSGSISLYVNGVFISPSAYTVSGTLISLNSGSFGSGADVVCMWATANSTPGGTSLGGGVLRGTSIASATTSGVTVALPTGALVGDLAFVFVGSCNGVNSVPSGWTAQITGGGSFWADGAVYYKTLSSGDISTGSVAINTNGAGGVIAICACCHGNPGVIRESPSSYSGFGTNATISVSTSGAVISTDFGLLFVSNRGSVQPTCNIGALQQGAVASGGIAAAALYLYQPSSSGAFTAIGSYSGYSPSGYFQTTVVVET